MFHHWKFIRTKEYNLFIHSLGARQLCRKGTRNQDYLFNKDYARIETTPTIFYLPAFHSELQHNCPEKGYFLISLSYDLAYTDRIFIFRKDAKRVLKMKGYFNTFQNVLKDGLRLFYYNPGIDSAYTSDYPIRGKK
jgi:hypothetical protein